MIELDRKGTAMRHKPWQQCDVCRAISTNAILARCHDVAGILYPNNAGARFNHDYYRDKHMPLIKARRGNCRAKGDRRKRRDLQRIWHSLGIAFRRCSATNSSAFLSMPTLRA